MESFNYFLDLILPRFCQSCKNKLSIDEKVVCTSCLLKIKYADEERISHEFERKFKDDKIISGFTSCFVFEKEKEFQEIIHQLKYNGKFYVGVFLGKFMVGELKHIFLDWEIDWIVPVPLHHLKYAERGYNQSEFIAKGIKAITGIPVKKNILKRTRFTETQTNLTLLERKQNIAGAFSLKRRAHLEGKTILLLDDVITTGATISECGRVLLEAGVAKVYAASVAVAD